MIFNKLPSFSSLHGGGEFKSLTILFLFDRHVFTPFHFGKNALFDKLTESLVHLGVQVAVVTGDANSERITKTHSANGTSHVASNNHVKLTPFREDLLLLCVEIVDWSDRAGSVTKTKSEI